MINALRPDQHAVVQRFLDWLEELRVDGAAANGRKRWAHVVLPPRTGKTVIAAHMAHRSGLHAAFLVPTRVLVHQTRRELTRHVPSLPVGAWFGEVKRTVPRGLNVATYASLGGHHRRWSRHLAEAELVFVDEAHHALTPARRRALEEAFPPHAVRVALTATPDYDAERRVGRHFPHELARVELKDAMRRGLVAPARVHVAEVDVDGSTVEIVAGDYRPDQLSRLLSHAPFLQAALAFRYQTERRGVPCMIACVTRQQADDLVRFFDRHRPPGRPPPELVLGDTPAERRERILRDFEEGHVDTLVQVGVLIEGWSSPRCKLLIDLAPGMSRVRATQKYFRALTRNGDATAELVVLLPRGLSRPPVLPMDLLLEPGDVYVCGRTLGAAAPSPIERSATSPIHSVRLVQRVVVSAAFGEPTLDRSRPDDVRSVLVACPDFDPNVLPGRQAFEALYLSHPLFSGTGRMLLNWLGVSRRTGAYDAWLARIFPLEVADRWLGREDEPEDGVELVPWDEASAAEAVQLSEASPCSDPEEALLRSEAIDLALGYVDELPARHRLVLSAWCGLGGSAESTQTEVAEVIGRSRERTRQILLDALRQCRQGLHDAHPGAYGWSTSRP